jgi:hypothetical protein
VLLYSILITHASHTPCRYLPRYEHAMNLTFGYDLGCTFYTSSAAAYKAAEPTQVGHPSERERACMLHVCAVGLSLAALWHDWQDKS